MAMSESEVTKLRILVPDSRHAVKKVARVFNGFGIPMMVRENSSTHLEFPQDDPAFPYTYILQKNAGIPELVAAGRFPGGVTTTDRLEDYRLRASLSGDEQPTSVEELLKFPVFNPLLRVSVLVREDSSYQDVADLNMNGRVRRVATSYMGLAAEYFEEHSVRVELDGRGGKEEELVRDGDADAAVVVVDKGTEMRRTMLRELGDPVMGRRRLEDQVFGRGELTLVLICNPELLERDESIRLLVNQLTGALQSTNSSDGRGRSNGSLSHVLVLKSIPEHIIESQIPAAS